MVASYQIISATNNTHEDFSCKKIYFTYWPVSKKQFWTEAWKAEKRQGGPLALSFCRLFSFELILN